MKKRRFNIGSDYYDIPETEVDSFLKDNPHATEVKNYLVKGSEYNIPIHEADAFETDMGLKKKEPSVSSNGTSPSQTTSQPDFNFFDRFGRPIDKTPQRDDDPIGNIVRPLQVKKKNAISQNLHSDMVGVGVPHPREIKSNVDNIEHEINTVTSNAFPNANVAHEYLKQKLQGKKVVRNNDVFNQEHHVTNEINLADYNLNSIKNNLDKTNITDQIAFDKLQKEVNLNKVLNHSVDLNEAAINFAETQSPQIKRQVEHLKNTGEKLPDAYEGQIISNFLNDPDVIEKAKTNPEFAHQYQQTQEMLYYKHPEFGKKVVAQKIAQAREDRDMNNPIVNIPTQGGTDDLVYQLYTEGKLNDTEKTIYEKSIRPSLGVGKSIGRGIGRLIPVVQAAVDESPLPTPDFLSNFENSYVNTLRGTAHSIEDFAGVANKSQRLSESLNRDYSTASINPKGFWHQASQEGGNLTGFVLPMIMGGTATKALGMSENVGNLITTGLMFEGNNRDAALKMFPDNPTKQFLYTTLATGGDMMLGKLIPVKEARQGVNNLIKNDIKATINDLVDGKINAAAAKSTLLEKATSYVGNIAKENVKMGGTMAGFSLFHNALDAAFGGRDVSANDAANEAIQSFKAGFLGGTFINALAAKGKNTDAKLNGKIIRDLAERPQEYATIITDQAKLHPELADTKEEKLNNLYDAVAINNDLEHTDLTDAQKEKYIIQGLSQRVWERKAAEVSDDVIKKKYLDKAEVNKKAKEKIFNGEDKATEHEAYTEPEIISEEKPSNTSEDVLSQNQPAKAASDEGAAILGEESATPVKDKWDERVSTIDTEKSYTDINELKEGDVIITKTGTLGFVKKVNPKKVIIESTYGGMGGNDVELMELSVSKDEISQFKKPKIENKETENKVPNATTETISTETGDNKNSQPTSSGDEEISTTKPAVITPTEVKEIQDHEIVPPTKPPVENEPNEGEPNNVGVSHKSLTELAKKLGLKEPERGDYIEPHEYAERGRKLLEAGASLEDVNNSGNDLYDRIAIARAHLEDLTAKADDVAKEFGEKSDEYKKANQEVENYATETVKKLGTLAHRAMVSLQGERDLNTGSFTAVKQAYEKSKGGKVTQEQAQKISQLTKENESLKKQAKEAEQKLVEATDEHIGEKGEKKTYAEKAKKVADAFRKLKTKPFVFKDSKGNEIKIHTQGITWNDAVEFGAKVIEKTGEVADGVAEVIDKIKDTDWYKGFDDSDKKKFETELTQHYQDAIDNTPEGKELNKLRNRKEKLESGNLDKEGKPEINFSDKQKAEYEQLKKDIKDLEDALGLKQKTGAKAFTTSQTSNNSVKKLGDLMDMFADKKGNKFTAEESKALWEYAKSEYLDKGIPYRDMFSYLKDDLGLSFEQIHNAITTPKTAPISDAMWRKQADLRKAQIRTKDFIDKANRNVAARALKGVSDLFRAVAVFAHGHIFVGTHAGMTLFDFPRARNTVNAFFRSFKFAYGNTARYERAMAELKARPNFTLAERAGLQNDPNETNVDEYQKFSKFFGKIGQSGVKGFNSIKVLRQDLFDNHFNRLSAAEKADPAVAKSIAHLVNNATGATNIKIPAAIQEISFAANMEGARWEKLTSNPIKATSTALKALITPDKATTGEKVFAKVWASRVGFELATYAGLLVTNAAIQSLINPNNKVNFTDPNKPDFLKFKFGEKDVNMTSGMLGAMQFMYGVGKIATENQKDLNGDTRLQALGKGAFGYVRGKASPFAGTILDLYTHTDFNGNVLPFYSDKPRTGKHNLTGLEYFGSKLPIPVADAFKTVYDKMNEQGMDKPKIENFLAGLMTFAETASTGFRISDSYHKATPYTEEDKKDPTFKYWIDKGLELPNTALTSETVTDEDAGTKKKVSDYPKDIQEKYIKEHKSELRDELSAIKENGVVYIKYYTDAQGKKVSEVSLKEPKGESKEIELDKLSKEEAAQVLSLAQKKATASAKKKVFAEAEANY